MHGISNTKYSLRSSPSANSFDFVGNYLSYDMVCFYQWLRLGGHFLKTEAKAEGTAPKAAWNWGRNSSVVNYPLGEPGRIPLLDDLYPIVCRPFVRLRLRGRWLFFPCFAGELLNCGLREIWMKEWINQWLWKQSISFIGAPQGEPRIYLTSLKPFLGWEVTPWSLNIILSRFIRLFSYSGKNAFVAQRHLWTSKSLYGLQTALGQNMGLRLGSTGLKRGFSFPWVKRYIIEGSGEEHLSP